MDCDRTGRRKDIAVPGRLLGLALVLVAALCCACASNHSDQVERVRHLDGGAATHRYSARCRHIRPRCQSGQPDHRTCASTPGSSVGAARRCVGRTHRRQLGHRGADLRGTTTSSRSTSFSLGQGRWTDSPLRIGKGANVGHGRREYQRTASGLRCSICELRLGKAVRDGAGGSRRSRRSPLPHCA